MASMAGSIDNRYPRRFRPALPQTLATLVLLPAFLSLAGWQLQRADYKARLFAAETAAMQAPPRPVSEASPSPWPRHLHATGRYDERVFLLDNQVREGRVGYHLLAPLRIDETQAVLVNLGWVGQGRSRERLPPVEVPTGTVHVTGLGMTPEPPPFELSEREAFADGWPKVVQTAVPGVLEEKLDYGLQPVVLYPDGSAVAAHKAEAMRDFGPSRHRAYAAQWFGFALVLVIVYLWHGLHRGRQSRGKQWKT